jgi:hypothetical protein
MIRIKHFVDEHLDLAAFAGLIVLVVLMRFALETTENLTTVLVGASVVVVSLLARRRADTWIMTKPESETANKAGYLKAPIHDPIIAMGVTGVVIFAVVIAVQLIVAALGFVLDHHCRSGGGKEHCVTAARTPA